MAGWLRDYAVAFANAKGGDLVLGISDDVAGPEALHGCDGYVLDDLRKRVYEGTHPPITVDFEEHRYEAGVFLVMRVPPSPVVHATSSGRRLQRVGKDNQTVYPDQDLELDIDKGGDYTAKTVRGVGMEGVDPLQVHRLRPGAATTSSPRTTCAC